MKKTEKISLGGLAFIVEYDAYAELESYLAEIHECFRNDASADEILEDIEVRIAELLREKCKEGMVANLEMINEIKKRIGDPKELAGQEESGTDVVTEEETAGEPKRKSLKDRRLYRNTDDRMLAGVCSGLSIYFNLDKVLFRLAFLIAFCLGFFEAEDGLFGLSVLTYIVLWIAMPAARTVEQKCEMRNRPIDLKEFKTKENRFGREINETVSSPAFRTAGRVFLTIIGLIMIILGLGGFLSTIVFPSIPELIENYLIPDSLIGEEIIIGKIACDPTFWWMIFGVIGLGSLGMMYGGIMLCFDFRSPSWRPGLVIFILWIVSILVLASWILHEVAEQLPMIV